MVHEMAKQHLNIETQLNKRGKRILGRGMIYLDIFNCLTTTFAFFRII